MSSGQFSHSYPFTDSDGTQHVIEICGNYTQSLLTGSIYPIESENPTDVYIDGKHWVGYYVKGCGDPVKLARDFIEEQIALLRQQQ